MKTLVALFAVVAVAMAQHWVDHSTKWHGPIALPPGYDKHGAPLPVHDLPEVTAEKVKHMSILARAGGSVHPVLHTPHTLIHDNPLWNVHALPAGVHSIHHGLHGVHGVHGVHVL